jgi:hypothetical protein
MAGERKKRRGRGGNLVAENRGEGGVLTIYIERDNRDRPVFILAPYRNDQNATIPYLVGTGINKGLRRK